MYRVSEQLARLNCALNRIDAYSAALVVAGTLDATPAKPTSWTVDARKMLEARADSFGRPASRRRRELRQT
jgi:hypothetical protein